MATIVIPPVDTYLTDGTRLGCVTGYGKRGEVIAEDCKTNTEFFIGAAAIGNWMTPEEWAARRTGDST